MSVTEMEQLINELALISKALLSAVRRPQPGAVGPLIEKRARLLGRVESSLSKVPLFESGFEKLVHILEYGRRAHGLLSIRKARLGERIGQLREARRGERTLTPQRLDGPGRLDIRI